MITQSEAFYLKKSVGKTIWSGEDFATAVIRLDREIRESAGTGADGHGTVFNPRHVPALLEILKQYGFTDAKVNDRDNFRIEISW